jgi:hypothetical protein
MCPPVSAVIHFYALFQFWLLGVFAELLSTGDFVLPVRPNTCNNVFPTGRILVKYGIFDIHQNLLTYSDFL